MSVSMLTYNHEKYVRQAVESVLMQQTSFEVDLVISDDGSSDGTPGILLDLDRCHPGRIRLDLAERNRGGVENFRENLRACRGDYIAFLDGDDYWTDARKLQMEAEYLDRHPECALCFHNARTVYENDSHPSRLYYRSDGRHTLKVSDLLARNFIPSCGVMVRNGLVGELPEWVSTLGGVGDWPYYILAAEHGAIGYLDEVMGTYRVHEHGLWSGDDETEQINRLIAIYRAFRVHLDSRHRSAIDAGMTRCYLKLSRQHERSGDRRTARRYAMRALVSGILRRSSDRKELFTRVLRLSIPGVRKLGAESVRGTG